MAKCLNDVGGDSLGSGCDALERREESGSREPRTSLFDFLSLP